MKSAGPGGGGAAGNWVEPGPEALTCINADRPRRGDDCLEFRQEVTIGGTTGQADGTACRWPDRDPENVPWRRPRFR